MFTKQLRIAIVLAMAPAMASATSAAAPAAAAAPSEPSAGGCLFAQGDACQDCVSAAACQARYETCLQGANEIRRQMCEAQFTRCQQAAELRCRRQCNPRG